MVEIKNKSLEGYSFIDLFAGIGGFHYALGSFGSKCVYASEWDKPAAYTYFVNHHILPDGDITKVSENNIPSHDILCAGFPCQAFSISGNQKGFDDTRGTLFFDVARIAKYHKPKVLFLENVKNLLKHDNGKTFRIIHDTLRELGYAVYYKVINSGDFGVPQHRERIYIVAFRNDLSKKDNFQFPEIQIKTSLYSILEDNPTRAKIIERDDIKVYKKPLAKTSPQPNRPLQIGIVNKGGQGERIYDPMGHSITLSAYGGGAGAKTGLYLIDNVVRKLSPRECARLQGFEDNFVLSNNDMQSYKQFGNGVTINVLQYILYGISEILKI